MKEMKTLKFPNQEEAYEIVDAYAREQIVLPIDPIRLPEGYPYKEDMTIEWDGNIEGRASVANQYFKVSDTVFDDLVGYKIAYYIQMPDTQGERRETVVNGYGMDGGVYLYKVEIAELGGGFPLIAVVPNGHGTYEAGTYFATAGDGAIYVTALISETIHTMAEEFLPASATAQSDLSQTDYTQTDYVKGVLRNEHLPEGYPYKEGNKHVIIWDGDTDGKVDVSGYYTKVSDLTPSIDELKPLIIAETGGYEGTTPDEVQDDISGSIDWLVSNDEAVVTVPFAIIYKDDVTVEVEGSSFVFPEKGLYFGAAWQYGRTGYMQWGKETIHPIAPEFLPEGYPYKEGWSIEWDGNIEGLTSVDNMWYKVSDITVTNEEIKNATMVMTGNNTTNSIKISEFGSQFGLDIDAWEYCVSNGLITDDACFFVLDLLWFAVVRKENVTADGHTFPEIGTYFMYMDDTLYVSGLNNETIHTIDQKYIPDTIARNAEVHNIELALESKQDSLTDIVWMESTMPYDAHWYTIAYGDDKFVAVLTDSTVAVYSTDGITWTETTLPSSSPWYKATYGDDKFVVITTYDDTVAYSTDGINWVATNLPSSGQWESIVYGNGKFIAVTYNSNVAAYSTDGITWIATTMPSTANWKSVTYGNGKFVAVARDSTASAYSTDGINWIATTMPSNAKWDSVTYGNGKFVAIAYNSNTASYSVDGINWITTTMPSSAYSWNSITYGNGKFVVTTAGSNIAAYSADGINWYESIMPKSGLWKSIAYGNGKFVAVAEYNGIAAYAETPAVLVSGFESEVIEMINKNVPTPAQSDWNQNDETAPDYVKNRPFYTADPVETVILEEQSVTIDSDGGNAILMVSLSLIKGLTYIINFNGTAYECVAWGFDRTIAIGNSSLAGVDTYTSEAPFIIATAGSATMIMASTAGTYTISITGMLPEVVKIPLEYLQNSNIVNGEGEGSLKTIYATEASGKYSYAEGYNTTASGDYSHAEGNNTTASGIYSHAEGFDTQATIQCSHAEGWGGKATGANSHAEGMKTEATGANSHAEGMFTDASGDESHAEGSSSRATGNASHAEGQVTTADGNFSHAEGLVTVAKTRSQHVQGEYNIEDTGGDVSTRGTYAHIVGNGTGVGDMANSNAHTLDWSGNAWFAGDVYVGSTSGTNKDEGSKILATQEYVDIRVPAWTEADEGKVLRIVNGVPTWATGVVTNG